MGHFIKRHNFVLYTCLFAISFTSSLHCEQQGASPKEALMLRRITEYWKDGDYATVKRQIEDFLDKNPETSLRDHLQAMLGDLYFQEQDFRQALATYNLIANPEIRSKTFFNHLQAHFELKDYSGVIEKAENYLKDPSTPSKEEDIKIRYLLAEACFREALKCKDMEQKVHFLKMAKPHYKVLSQTKYGDKTLFPLAEIHRLLREDARASALYLQLADLHPQHRERFLFQAAVLQIKNDKNEALKTFAKIQALGGKRSRLAAFNQLIILYQSEKFKDYLALYKNVIHLMPQQKVALLQFYEGRCHYHLKDYPQAIMAFENFITASKGRSKELKSALLLLVNCARFSQDIPLLERTMYSFKDTFSMDKEMPRIIMIHAQMCRENGDLVKALNDLKTLVNEYPQFEEMETACYDFGLLLVQMDKWREAQTQFNFFLEKFPESERRNAAWRHLINSSIEELKNAPELLSKEPKENFVRILEQALERDEILNAQEKQKYILILAKCKYELEKYESVIPILSQYIADHTSPEVLSEAHLLMAICQQKSKSDDHLFIFHGEKALSYNPDLPEKEILHLELYNAYLNRAILKQDQSQEHNFMQKAAEHLYLSKIWKEQGIKPENYLWLMNHYYHKATQGSLPDFEKAYELFSVILKSKDESLSISSDSMYLENEALKFAYLLGLNKRFKEQVSVLEKLVHKQEEYEQLPWKLKRRAVLELAKAYEHENQFQNALNSYQYLVNTGEGIASMVTTAAQLHLAKLEFRLLKPEKRVNDNPEVVALLHSLKDLQIQKKLLAEPLHLEAALSYAEIRTALSEEGEQWQNGIFFFKRMQEDFRTDQDPIAEEYHRLCQEHPEKNALFLSYMKYADALILQSEAEIALVEENKSKAHECERQALEILQDLLKNPESLQPYLLDRVQRKKAEIAKKL